MPARLCSGLSLLILIAFQSPAHSRIYYVDQAGNDANSGRTTKKAWKTPHRAVTTARAGDTVIFRDGIYNVTKSVRISTKGTATAPIVFKAQNRHGAKIHMSTKSKSDATITLGIYKSGKWLRHQKMYITIDGLDISGGRRHAIQAPGGGRIVIKNNKIHSSGNDPVKINHSADFTIIENNEIYNSGVNDRKCIETHTCNSDGIDITSSDYVIVRNNHIHDIRSWGIYTKKGSEYNIIENNLIHDTQKGGISLGESSVTYNAVARNNILYNIDMTCLQAAGAKDSKFYNNTCYNVSNYNGSNWAGMRIAPAASLSGVKTGDDKHPRNVEFINNIIVLNNDSGTCLKIGKSVSPKVDLPTLLRTFHIDHNLCYNKLHNTYDWRLRAHREYDITGWRRYTLSMGKTLGANDIIADPLFISTDPSSSNFLRPSAKSPVINAGYDLGDTTNHDFRGRLRESGAFDLGAIER